jgi:HSP20 family protein
MAAENKSLDVRKSEITRADSKEITRDRMVFIPRADIYEDGDHIILLADVPGADEKSLDITLEKNVLTIKAFVEPDDPANYNQTYREYQIGDYQRSFVLTDEIDRNGIEATVKDGVLRMTLPKAGPAKTQRITVKTR